MPLFVQTSRQPRVVNLDQVKAFYPETHPVSNKPEITFAHPDGTFTNWEFNSKSERDDILKMLKDPIHRFELNTHEYVDV